MLKNLLSKTGSAVVAAGNAIVHTDLRDMGVGIAKASVVTVKGTVVASKVTAAVVTSASVATVKGVADVSVASAKAVRHPVSTVKDHQSNRAEYRDFKASQLNDDALIEEPVAV